MNLFIINVNVHSFISIVIYFSLMLNLIWLNMMSNRNLLFIYFWIASYIWWLIFLFMKCCCDFFKCIHFIWFIICDQIFFWAKYFKFLLWFNESKCFCQKCTINIFFVTLISMIEWKCSHLIVKNLFNFCNGYYNKCKKNLTNRKIYKNFHFLCMFWIWLNFVFLVIAKNVSNETTLSKGEFQLYFKMFVKVFI
jgi:hypothetical protein